MPNELLESFLGQQNYAQLHLFAKMLLLSDQDNKLSNLMLRSVHCRHKLFQKIHQSQMAFWCDGFCKFNSQCQIKLKYSKPVQSLKEKKQRVGYCFTNDCY